MKIFFRMVCPRGDENGSPQSFGINRANGELALNLIRYSRSVDEFGFVEDDPERTAAFQKLFPDKVIKTYDFRNELDLAGILAYYDIFFTGSYKINDILRCQTYFHEGLSVIGITHSLHLKDVAVSIREASGISSHKDVLVCTSSAGKKSIQAMMKDRPGALTLETIPLGLDIDTFSPVDGEEKRGLRHRFDLPENASVFLSLGRLSPDEKMELTPLLKVFAELVRDSTSGQRGFLLIVGREHNGGYGRILMELAHKLGIARQVRLITGYETSSIPLFYRLSDVFISPSDNIQETFGLTVLEAMASGLPVIVSDWDGYRDTVIHGATGFRIPTYWADCGTPWDRRFRLSQSVAMDMDVLQNAMKALLEDVDLRHKMAGKARAHVESSFSWKDVIRQYDRLFNRVSGGIRDPHGTGLRPETVRETDVKPSDLFRAYPTSFLTDSFHIRIRDLNGFTGYSNVINLVDTKQVDRIARLVTGGLTGVGEITRHMRETYQIPDQDTLFQIMVMMKYGVFAPAGQAPVHESTWVSE